MYYLEELEKDEFGYVNYCKKVAEEYFIKFFGEKYSRFIKNKLKNLPLIFLEAKNQAQAVKNIDYEYQVLLILWLGEFFDYNNAVSLGKIGDEKIQQLREYAVFSANNEQNREKIKEILTFLCPDEEINVDFDLVERMKENYKDNYSSKMNQLLNIQMNLLNFENKYGGFEYKNYDDLLENKYIKQIFDKLSEFQKSSLLKIVQNFIKNSTSDASFNDTFNFYNKKNKFKACLFARPEILTTTTFVHELLHAISSQKIETYKANIFRKSGLARFIFNGVSKQGYYKYNYLDEICTDYFANEISLKIVHDKHQSLFLAKHNDSLYSFCFVLVKKLFKKHIDLLKECYITDDFNKINEVFGKENLQQLNDLLLDYTSYLDNMAKNKVNFKLPKKFDEALNKYKSLKPEDVSCDEYKYFECFDRMDKLTDKIERNIKKYNEADKDEEMRWE